MRINARLDDETKKELEFIRKETGDTVTQIIKRLLVDYARQLRRQKQPGHKLKQLLESDFVGCHEGPEDGSVRYKEYISDYLEEKHGHR